jgi:hypothetical protein
MNTPFQFVLATLAVWRFTHLIAAEDGPFQLIARVRMKVGTGFWGGLLDCFYCLSLWVALPFALIMGASAWERFLLWAALSAAAILINRVADRVSPETAIYFEEKKE